MGSIRDEGSGPRIYSSSGTRFHPANPGSSLILHNGYHQIFLEVFLMVSRFGIVRLFMVGLVMSLVVLVSAWPQAAGAAQDRPAVPTGLAASPGEKSVVLSWDSPGDLGISGYNVYRRNRTDSGSWGLLAALDSRADPDNDGQYLDIPSGYVDSDISPRLSYAYRIRALRGSGAKSKRTDSVRITAPDFCVDIVLPPGRHPATHSSRSTSPREECFNVVTGRANWSYAKTLMTRDDRGGVVLHWLDTDGDGTVAARGADHRKVDGDYEIFLTANVPYALYVSPSGRVRADVPGNVSSRVRVPLGGELPGKVHSADDVDVFGIDVLCAERRHIIGVTSDGLDVPAEIFAVLGSGGEVIADGALTHNYGYEHLSSRMEFVPPGPGPYWVELRPRGDSDAGSYEVFFIQTDWQC